MQGSTQRESVWMSTLFTWWHLQHHNIIGSSLARFHTFFFSFFWWGESVEIWEDKLSRESEKGVFLVFELYLTERINLFSVRWCWWFQRQSLLDYSLLLYLLCREQQLYCIARTNTHTHGYAQMYVHPHLHAEKYATQRLIRINIYFKHHLIILIE